MQVAQRRAVSPWAIVGFLWIAYFINYVDRQLVFSQFPVLTRELGFTTGQLGLIGTTFLWAYSLTSPLAGRLADRLRLEWMVPGSLVLWSLATLGTGLSHSVSQLLLCRTIVGVTEGLYFPAAVAVIGSLHSTATRSRAIAIHGSAQFAGIVGGGWFGGWSAEQWTWRTGFVLLCILGLAYAPLLRWGLGRLPAREEKGATPHNWKEVFTPPQFHALCLAFFVLCAMLWMLYAWLPSLVHERFGLGLAESGLLATVFLQASSVAGILSGGAAGDWCAGRLAAGRFLVVAAGLAACAPFALLSVVTSSLVTFKIAAVGFGLFSGLMMSNVVASAYDVTHPRNYGLAAGVLTLLGGLSGGVATLTVGHWKETVGMEAIMGWTALAAFVAAAALLAAVVAGKRGRGGSEAVC